MRGCKKEALDGWRGNSYACLVSLTSGDSLVLFSSGSEICLRVMKACPPSAPLLCLRCLSTSPSLVGHASSAPRCAGQLKGRRDFLLHCGSLPPGGSGSMVDVERSSQVVLPLLPARRQCGQLLVLSGTRHVLVQKHPVGLYDMNTARGLTKGAQAGKRTPALFKAFMLMLHFYHPSR